MQPEPVFRKYGCNRRICPYRRFYRVAGYDTKREMKNVSEGVQSVYNAVYNDEGWSVFEGTITNEWVWSQNHPEAYQQYLQDKKQREQGLK